MTAHSQPELSAPARPRHAAGFTLIEVVLAMGIIVFAGISLVALLSSGLDSLAASNNEFAVANITRSLRASLEAMPYSAATTTTPAASPTPTPGPIPGPVYFTASGYPTVQGSTSDPAYFQATCTPVVTNIGASNSLINSSNAAVVTVKLNYPFPVMSMSSTFTLSLAQ